MHEQYEQIVNISKEIISLISRDYQYEVVNDAYCATIGKTRDEILGRTVAQVWGNEIFEKNIKGYLDRCFAGEKVEYIQKFKFGDSFRYMYVSYKPYAQNGEVTHAIVFSRDETKRKELESKLHNYEFKDPVTGLFNRRSLEMILEKEIERTKRSPAEHSRALLFIGLQDFSRINQTYGHHIGDVLLENSGIRISGAVRNSDYVFRFEGRELTVLLTNFKNKTDIAKVAHKIIQELAIPYRHRGGDILIKSHIGVALYPDDGGSSMEIIMNANAAMTEAKSAGQEFLFFNADLQQRSIERMKLENDMHQAFINKEYELKYQPIVMPDGTICGVEALIRWYHAERGMIAPITFIPLAEETGMIMSIGKWVLYQVCERLSAWSLRYGIYVSINVSAREFEDINLFDTIRGALKNADDLNPKYLKLEITETESMRNPEVTIERMKELANMGIEILIDDFGTGHSSLGYLKALPAGILKIDKVFVDEIAEDEEEREYLASIIRMGQSRKKLVVVEGVATADQANLLREMGCDRMQGFYFSKPLSAEELEGVLGTGLSLPLP